MTYEELGQVKPVPTPEIFFSQRIGGDFCIDSIYIPHPLSEKAEVTRGRYDTNTLAKGCTACAAFCCYHAEVNIPLRPEPFCIAIAFFYKALLFIKSVGRQPGKPTVDRKAGKTSRSGEAFRML